MMKLICSCCGRDINALGQDNMSCNEYPLCEDCYYDDENGFKDVYAPREKKL